MSFWMSSFECIRVYKFNALKKITNLPTTQDILTVVSPITFMPAAAGKPVN